MRTRRPYFVLIAALALVLAACGGSDDGADTTTTAGNGDSGVTDTTASGGETTTTTGSSGETPEPPAVGDMGSFTVNGTVFAVNLLNRCIPFDGPGSDQIDLQPLAQGAQLNLYGNAESVEVSVQGSTVQNMFGSIAFGSGEVAENSIDGDRWTGSATLDDALDAVDPVEVTWDVMIPDEIRDCSL